MLFTRGGLEPTELPAADMDGQGNTWTNLADNPFGREACGWTPVPAPMFDPATQRLEWMEVGWAVIDFTPAELTGKLDSRLDARLAELADLRWRRTQSFLFNGAPTPCDRDTRTDLAGKILRLQVNGAPGETFRFKVGVRSWITADLSAAVAFGTAIDAYVQTCFDLEEQLQGELIAAHAIGMVALDAVDITQGWP